MEERSQEEQDAFARAKEEASKLIGAVVGTLEMVGALAAPRAIAMAPRWPSREELLAQINSYLTYVDEVRGGKSGGNVQMLSSEPYALKLRALFNVWPISPPVPPEIVQVARDFFTAHGIDKPDSFWDEYEGPSENGKPPQQRES